MHFLPYLTAILLGQSPAAELSRAVADCETLSVTERTSVRYLSLYALPVDRRAEGFAIASFVLNSLSRTRLIVAPRMLDDSLLRFTIADYTANDTEFKEWSTAWDELAKLDPYWHIRTEVIAKPANLRPDPKPTDLKQVAVKQVTVDGGWVGLENAAKLKLLTGSQGALLRAEWFVEQATQPPAHYQFAGVPDTESAWLTSLGVDAKAIDKLRANLGANLIQSQVTNKPRRVIWQQGPLGGVYATLDVEVVTADRDFVRRPISADGFQAAFDASEWFAMAPNGLWRTALFDKNGKRQDAVPDKIAKDTSDPRGDGRVIPLISCIRCHTESGLRPFRDDQTTLLKDGVSLYSLKPEVIQRATEFYQEPRLQRQMKFDRETYSVAAAAATGGIEPEEISTSLGNVVRNHAYLPVTLEQAARELGLAPEIAAHRFRTSRDPILLILSAGRPALRKQWESSFAEASVK